MDELDRIINAGSSSDTPQAASPSRPAASLLDSLSDLQVQGSGQTAPQTAAQQRAAMQSSSAPSAVSHQV